MKGYAYALLEGMLEETPEGLVDGRSALEPPFSVVCSASLAVAILLLLAGRDEGRWVGVGVKAVAGAGERSGVPIAKSKSCSPIVTLESARVKSGSSVLVRGVRTGS